MAKNSDYPKKYWVSERTQLCGNSQLFGTTMMSDMIWLSEFVRLSWFIKLSGFIQLSRFIQLSEFIQLSGITRVSGMTRLYGMSWFLSVSTLSLSSDTPAKRRTLSGSLSRWPDGTKSPEENPENSDILEPDEGFREPFESWQSDEPGRRMILTPEPVRP